VARPAVSFPDLKERLEARMKWLGIKVWNCNCDVLCCAVLCCAVLCSAVRACRCPGLRTG
jgi:hypothetical protein